MASLAEVLSRYAVTGVAPMGRTPRRSAAAESAPSPAPTAPAAEAPLEIDSAALAADLNRVRKSNEQYFQICVAMVVSLFVVTVWLILANLDKPGTVRFALGAFGVSTSGLLYKMIDLWREKNRLDVVLTLAAHLKGNVLVDIVTVLRSKL